jgi:hypothetical protein
MNRWCDTLHDKLHNKLHDKLYNSRWRHGRMPVVLVAFCLCWQSAVAAPALPLRSGQYVFQHHFAEHPTMASIQLVAKITGHHIVLINHSKSDIFPLGVIAEGELMWHAQTGQWIIVEIAADRYAKDVGGCSDGPEVIDLVKRIYWTC